MSERASSPPPSESSCRAALAALRNASCGASFKMNWDWISSARASERCACWVASSFCCSAIFFWASASAAFWSARSFSRLASSAFCCAMVASRRASFHCQPATSEKAASNSMIATAALVRQRCLACAALALSLMNSRSSSLRSCGSRSSSHCWARVKRRPVSSASAFCCEGVSRQIDRSSANCRLPMRKSRSASRKRRNNGHSRSNASCATSMISPRAV